MRHSKKGKSSRVYFHYTELEEFAAGLWKRPTGETRKDFIQKAANLMKQSDEFKTAMAQALDDWPKSCAHNLTALDSNRIAWLGHAGCSIATGSPEECTRVGWHTLTQEEQDEANRVAGEVLAVWDEENRDKTWHSKIQLELMF